MNEVRLGQFQLGEQIGEGGMGAVYRAAHRETGERVAVKVLLSERTRDPEQRREFRREVQTLAQLHHPAIASILDYGELDANTSARGPETFAEGARWFAMEHVEGRPLKASAPDWNWAQLKAFLLTTLDALAHAHARSTIHRDLKPSNILVQRSDDTPSGIDVTLVDFGIAQIFDPETQNPETSSSRVVGTPKYMPPEQILAKWRDQGPWTDLYALGCVTWRITCGTPPFDGDTTERVLKSHLQEPLGELDPRFPVPEGFEEWLAGLLCKDLERRTPRAADAAWRLLELGRAEAAFHSTGATGEADATSPLQPTLDEMTTTLRDRSSMEGDETAPPTRLERPADGSADSVSHSDRPTAPAIRPPPMLSDWRRDEHGRTAAAVPEAGLELFALREVPVVDREPERDRLWSALEAVHANHEPRLVTLEAGAGTGKSRLAEWLCRRAHETGAARILEANHTDAAMLDEGLRRMVRRTFRTSGLPRDEVHERLLARLPTRRDGDMRLIDARALTELLRPTDDEAEDVNGPRYRFSSTRQKYALVRRLFDRMAARRPTVVWFDDLQWGRESIGVLEDLFTTVEKRPSVLVVATVRSDLVSENPDLGERLESLWERAEASRIQLSSLDSDYHRVLLDRLLHLDARLADTIARRTEGNPLFAIQLLENLVDGGRLEAGPDGFRLPAGESLDLPDNVHDLWVRRLRRLVADLALDEDLVWRAIERAAALGREIDGGEWEAVCDELGIDSTGELHDALIVRGLAERTESGWAFTHGLLVDAIERRARRGGRWKDHQRHCANLLERVHPDRPRQTAARRAEHWIEADELERALEPLMEEKRRLRGLGETDGEREVLERRETLLDELGSDASDPRRIENDIEHTRADLVLGGSRDQANNRITDARGRAETIDNDRLLAKASRFESFCLRQAGKLEEARRAAQHALRRARESGEQRVLLDALIEIGFVEYVRGNLDEAERHYVRARTVANRVGDRYRDLLAKQRIGWVVMSRGDDEQAQGVFEECLEEVREAGYRTVAMRCLNGLGEAARFRREAEAARHWYREFGRIAREIELPGDYAASLGNLAQAELVAGRYDVAGEHLRTAERLLEEVGRKEEWLELLLVTHLVRSAGLGDWPEFDERFARYADGWPKNARLLRDHPWLLEMAGDIAAEDDCAGRARDLWQLARRLWERLGNEEAAESVASKLEA